MGSEDPATRELNGSETAFVEDDISAPAGVADSRVQPARVGRFLVIDKLGRGGMGIVYSGYDPELDRRVAIKVLRLDRGSGKMRDKRRQRLIRRRRLVCVLRHGLASLDGPPATPPC